MNNLTKKEKEEFLIERGWITDERIDRRFWYSPEKDGVGYPLDMAYKTEISRDEQKAREEALKNYTAECHCNNCGSNLLLQEDLGKGDVKPVGYYGLVDASLTSGYFSKHLHDTLRYTFSLCEKCLVELFRTFKSPPEVVCYFDGKTLIFDKTDTEAPDATQIALSKMYKRYGDPLHHHGDCDMYAADNPCCSCGLIHDLLPYKKLHKLYSKFEKDWFNTEMLHIKD